jgi:hypothetical protein
MQKNKSISQPLIWAIVLGLVGLISGILGPILFQPGANQGPLMGVFFTGPLGFIIGGILGALVSKYQLTQETHLFALGGASLITFILILVVSVLVIEDRYLGVIIDAEILACETPDRPAKDRIVWWENRLNKYKDVTPPVGWKEKIDAKLNDAQGVVLEVQIYKKKIIFETRKPWNRGKKKIDLQSGDSKKTKSFYSTLKGNSCSNYPIGNRAQYFENNRMAAGLPPLDVPAFLGLTKFTNIPLEFHQFAND